QNYDWWWGADAEREQPTNKKIPWLPSPRRGLPLKPDGKPHFVSVPERYSANLKPGEKVLYLLGEIERLDVGPRHDEAARALLVRAQICRALYGPRTDPLWEKAWREHFWSSFPRRSRLAAKELLKDYADLKDDQVRTLVDGEARLIVLPDSDNPLALLAQLERCYPQSRS